MTPVSDPGRTIFQSDLVRVGLFRCPVHHPLFTDSGPTKGHCFVFPRAPVWIEQAGRPAFVADSTVVPLYNPGWPFRRRRIAQDGDRTDWFAVSPALLREMLDGRDAKAADADTHLFRHSHARAGAGLFLAQRRVVQYIRTHERIDVLFVEEAVVGLLTEVLDSVYGQQLIPSGARQRDLAEAAREHLARTYASDEGLSDLARTVGTSVFHLCRVFKQQTGQTIHRHRRELRLRKALELVGESDQDLLTAALALGYSGHSHFTRDFRQAFGMTPSAFRRHIR